MAKIKFSLFTFCFLCNFLVSQAQQKLPVLDMHLHALLADDQGPPPVKVGAPFNNFGYHDPKKPYLQTIMRVFKSGEWSDTSITSPLTDDSLRKATLSILNKYNIYGVTSGDPAVVRRWHADDPKRIINAVGWNFYEAKKNGLTVDSLKKLFKSGEFKVFGEVTIQYEGYSPSDSAFEPYLKMAEELDIPVGIHVGPGPPGVAYMGAGNYRAKLHSATLLEEAMIKHPKLRIYAMHAGWPMLDDMIATLYAHPQLSVDLGIICYMLSEKEFYFYLKRIVEAGFVKRVMFGSDNMVWPQTIITGIERINKAPFLTTSQKRDILFNNAATFLRLSEEEIKNMNK